MPFWMTQCGHHRLTIPNSNSHAVEGFETGHLVVLTSRFSPAVELIGMRLLPSGNSNLGGLKAEQADKTNTTKIIDQVLITATLL